MKDKDLLFLKLEQRIIKSATNIYFGSKEDSNKRRQVEAWQRTPHERFLFFLQLTEEMQVFKTVGEHPNRVKDNFVIE